MIRPIACVLGGMLFAHGLDAPHLVRPDQLRDAANVIQGAVIAVMHYDHPGASVSRHIPVDGQAVLIKDTAPPLLVGSWNLAVGSFAGASMTTQNRAIALGSCTAVRLGDGFVNLGNRLCFWRDTGTIVDCPPPEPECDK